MSITILGINGSPHKEGHGVKLLSEALAQAEREGGETKMVHLVDHPVSMFPGDYSAETPKGYEELFELLSWADGIIFSSPVYWFSMSAVMKNFIEHITVLEEHRSFALQGKVATFIATCEEDGGQKVISDMAAPLVHMGFVIPPYSMLFHNKHMAEKSENAWQKEDHILVGANTVRMARLVKDQKKIWGYEGIAKA